MPSVLIETGFITNEKEEKFLGSKQGQEYMASAIFRAFRDYKNTIEKNSNFPQKDLNSIEFSLQLLSSTTPIDIVPENFKNIEGVQEFHSDGTFKYILGNETDYNAILILKEKIKEKFPDAFVIAIKSGEKIPLNEAIQQSKGN